MMEEADKKPRKIQPVILLVLVMVLLIIFHIKLHCLNWVIPLSAILLIKEILKWLLFSACLVFLPVLFISKIRLVHKFLLFIPFVLLACIGFLLSLVVVRLVDSLKFNNHQYFYFVTYMTGDSTDTCYMTECNINGLKCKQVVSSIEHCNDDIKVVLVGDAVNNEVNVFDYYNSKDRLGLYYTYGEEQRKYIAFEFSGDYLYSLGYSHEDGSNDYQYTLYRCINWTTTCERLPFQLNRDFRESSYSYHIIAEENGDVQVLSGKELIYTYGENPECHVEGCTLQK